MAVSVLQINWQSPWSPVWVAAVDGDVCTVMVETAVVYMCSKRGCGSELVGAGFYRTGGAGHGGGYARGE